MLTMRERIERVLGTKTSLLFTAPHLLDTAALLLDGRGGSPPELDARGISSTAPLLFLRSTLIPSEELARILPQCDPGTVFLSGEEIAGFLLPAVPEKIPLGRLLPPRRDVLEELSGGAMVEVDSRSTLIGAAWEMVRENARLLSEDFELLAASLPASPGLPQGVFARYEGSIRVAQGAELYPHVFLDAERGPIYIEEGARILSFSSLEGPAFVGRGSALCQASVRGGSSIGPVCRVGGEIECTIFQGYANKAHAGFIGHCVVGEWVNLGAGTTNSDLKNNYGPVRITTPTAVYETGMIKMGALIGDHVKTGIGTLIDTGAAFGTGANLFGGGIQPKFVPPFVWGGSAGFEEYRLEAFLKTARTMMERRGISLTSMQRKLLEELHRASAAERQAWLLRRGGGIT